MKYVIKYLINIFMEFTLQKHLQDLQDEIDSVYINHPELTLTQIGEYMQVREEIKSRVEYLIKLTQAARRLY